MARHVCFIADGICYYGGDRGGVSRDQFKTQREREKKTTAQIHSNRIRSAPGRGMGLGLGLLCMLMRLRGGGKKGVPHIDALAYLDAS